MAFPMSVVEPAKVAIDTLGDRADRRRRVGQEDRRGEREGDVGVEDTTVQGEHAVAQRRRCRAARRSAPPETMPLVGPAARMVPPDQVLTLFSTTMSLLLPAIVSECEPPLSPMTPLKTTLLAVEFRMALFVSVVAPVKTSGFVLAMVMEAVEVYRVAQDCREDRVEGTAREGNRPQDEDADDGASGGNGVGGDERAGVDRGPTRVGTVAGVPVYASRAESQFPRQQ